MCKEHYAQIGQNNCIKKMNCKLQWLNESYIHLKTHGGKPYLATDYLKKRFERLIGQKYYKPC